MREILRKVSGFFNFEERRKKEAEIKAVKLELLRRKRYNLPWQDLHARLRELQGKPYP